MSGTLAAVSVCAMMRRTAGNRGFGEVAEWFKAAVLKTACREHRSPARNLETRRYPSRNGRVPHPFAQNMAEHMSAHIPESVWRKRCGKVIYFVGPDGGAIKIGRTRDLKARMKQLQCSHAEPLRVWAITPGGNIEEALFHYWLRAHRLQGEWFARCPEVEAAIARLHDSGASCTLGKGLLYG